METKDDYHKWLIEESQRYAHGPYGAALLEASERYEQFLKDQGEVVVEWENEVNEIGDCCLYKNGDLICKLVDNVGILNIDDNALITVRRKP